VRKVIFSTTSSRERGVVKKIVSLYRREKQNISFLLSGGRLGWG
jgi:hypothetical protein